MLKHVTGVEIYLIFSLFVFVVFFIGMALWLIFFFNKKQVDYIRNIPLKDDDMFSNTAKIMSWFVMIFSLSLSNLSAQNTTSIVVTNQVFFEGMILYLVVICIVLALITLFVAFQLFGIIHKSIAPEDEKNLSIWQVLLGLKPITKEKDLMLPEKYDNIAELDNPVPAWFNVLFGGTVAFAVIYMMIYFVWKVGDFQEVEYDKEVQYASIQQEMYLKQIASLIDEKNVKQTTDKKALAEGEKIFLSNCASCHGKKLEGGVGPNLTDQYWLHGGDINQVFVSIKKGIPTKGMIAWEKKLNPLQIQNVSSYVLKMQGTNPPNAKEPQGEKVVAKAAKKAKK